MNLGTALISSLPRYLFLLNGLISHVLTSHLSETQTQAYEKGCNYKTGPEEDGSDSVETLS
jgi:hypothetical protein